MSRIDERIQQYCPDGVEYKALGDVGTLVRGNGLQKKDFTESGVGCIHYGQIYTYYGTYADSTTSHLDSPPRSPLVVSSTSITVTSF
ncbi:MAG: hypothetical protein LBV00_01995 [Propionibacteriaceae bacterium]|jgi:type I restriction enzyme S subunit|nr:hypothetical protein [Propionibacteriaceae bacterium]